ncbi:hypothetical protein [Treponema sp.]|uniref:hypothetical protein n=1 Tax=Treponema sp. TaxID=166 RepID=UPI00298E0BF4|nr:hypothetical protein [Treponema sp.]MCR5612692.1 hypothetical protein [Treponema sp.]
MYFINQMEETKGFKSFTGKIIDDQTFFFRKKMITFVRNDFDDANGTISIDRENRSVTVKGVLGYELLLIFSLIFFFPHFADLEFEKLAFTDFLPLILFALLFILIEYIINLVRLKKFEKKIQELIA